MTIEYREWITRGDLRREPDKLFVFGDNVQRRGHGGQAKEMRGEPNAVGIPTKWSPTMSPSAFFKNDDTNFFIAEASVDFRRLRDFSGTVVWPADDIGTGLAQLQRRAPRIWRLIQGLRQELEIELPRRIVL